MRLPRRQSPRRTTRRGSALATPSEVKQLVEPTFGLRTIDPEGVEFRELVQEAFLWRYRDDYTPVGEENGLTKLQIPVTHSKLAALERRHGKIWPLHVANH